MRFEVQALGFGVQCVWVRVSVRVCRTPIELRGCLNYHMDDVFLIVQEYIPFTTAVPRC